MRNQFLGLVRPASLSRLVTVTAASALLAACSTSVDRFTDYPSTSTASIKARADTGGGVAETVSRSPIENSAPSAGRPAWQNYGQPAAPAAPQPSTSTALRAPAAPSAPAAARAGTVRVQPGQTMYSIARANNVSVGELAAANNIPAPYTVAVGQQLRIPGSASPVSPAPSFQAAAAPAPARSFGGGDVHTVKPGETLFSVGRTYNVSPYKIAEHNGLANDHAVRVGEQLRIPGGAGRMAQAAPAPAPAEAARTAQAEVAAPQLARAPAAKDNSQVMSQETTIDQPAAAAEDAGTGFRWPVRGRVISAYGSKPNGTRNEGINIAVPEGTAVRAAESGVVAYAGNELKGYGELVLVRHQNGWVTAYAHNKELMVKRGDTVRRGDIVAKAGQTGSVTSPQLHFELRKGASAVDPMKYLGSATASN